MTPREQQELRALRRSTMGGQREISNGRSPLGETMTATATGDEYAGLDPELELRARRQAHMPPDLAALQRRLQLLRSQA